MNYISADTTRLYTGLMYSEAAEFLKTLKGKYFKTDIINISDLKQALSSESFIEELDCYISKNTKKANAIGSYFTKETFIFCINENINVI